MDPCEWNPAASLPALVGVDGCPNPATVSCGRGRVNWHLCADCARLPLFRRYSQRPLPTPTDGAAP